MSIAALVVLACCCPSGVTSYQVPVAVQVQAFDGHHLVKSLASTLVHLGSDVSTATAATGVKLQDSKTQAGCVGALAGHPISIGATVFDRCVFLLQLRIQVMGKPACCCLLRLRCVLPCRMLPLLCMRHTLACSGHLTAATNSSWRARV
jgi:hypothetical protein